MAPTIASDQSKISRQQSPNNVRWNDGAAATPHGQLVFFAEFFGATGLFVRYVSQCPLASRSGNAPEKRDVLGAPMPSLLAGHRRYAHITALCGDAGARGQIFFVRLGGFDTRDNQNQKQSELLARVAHAMSYFDTALGAINARNMVTTFTASDFGRTFTSYGDGTDHGWGAHQFVMGGAVRGGDLYGKFPTLVARTPGTNSFDGSPDQTRNGAVLPTTSVDQLGATLARRFGLPESQQLEVFPNLTNFNTSVRNLGFLKA